MKHSTLLRINVEVASNLFMNLFLCALIAQGSTVLASPNSSLQIKKQKGTSSHTYIEPKSVLIPAGSFQMGLDRGQAEYFVRKYKDKTVAGVFITEEMLRSQYSEQTPKHTVFLKAYRISKNLVTVGEYKIFCLATHRRMPPRVPKFNLQWHKNNHPIVGVSHEDANAYCQWLSRMTGKSYRLPSEAEWEKAARGGLKGTLYPWGKRFDPKRLHFNRFNRSLFTVSGTAPVGSYPPNGYGLFDMAGNTAQWCLDGYDPTYYRISPKRNPISNPLNDTHVLRGGHFFDTDEDRFTCANRMRGGSPVGIEGFRCVLEIKPPFH